MANFSSVSMARLLRGSLAVAALASAAISAHAQTVTAVPVDKAGATKAVSQPVTAQLRQSKVVVGADGREQLLDAASIKPGDVIEYRIGYTNTSAQAVTQVVITDATPAYTSFVAADAPSTPAALGTCTKHTPQNASPAAAVACAASQTAGGTGPIEWSFSGQLEPAQTGYVTFRVSID